MARTSQLLNAAEASITPSIRGQKRDRNEENSFIVEIMVRIHFQRYRYDVLTFAFVSLLGRRALDMQIVIHGNRGRIKILILNSMRDCFKGPKPKRRTCYRGQRVSEYSRESRQLYEIR